MFVFLWNCGGFAVVRACSCRGCFAALYDIYSVCFVEICGCFYFCACLLPGLCTYVGGLHLKPTCSPWPMHSGFFFAPATFSVRHYCPSIFEDAARVCVLSVGWLVG